MEPVITINSQWAGINHPVAYELNDDIISPFYASFVRTADYVRPYEEDGVVIQEAQESLDNIQNDYYDRNPQIQDYYNLRGEILKRLNKQHEPNDFNNTRVIKEIPECKQWISDNKDFMRKQTKEMIRDLIQVNNIIMNKGFNDHVSVHTDKPEIDYIDNYTGHYRFTSFSSMSSVKGIPSYNNQLFIPAIFAPVAFTLNQELNDGITSSFFSHGRTSCVLNFMKPEFTNKYYTDEALFNIVSRLLFLIPAKGPLDINSMDIPSIKTYLQIKEYIKECKHNGNFTFENSLYLIEQARDFGSQMKDNALVEVYKKSNDALEKTCLKFNEMKNMDMPYSCLFNGTMNTQIIASLKI